MVPPMDNSAGEPALVVPGNQSDPTVRGSTRSHNVRGSIRTLVVDDDHFVGNRKRLEGILNLTENSFNVSRLVQRRHNQGKLFVLGILRIRLDRQFVCSGHVLVERVVRVDSSHCESRQLRGADRNTAVPFVGDEAELSEAIHKETDSGSGCAN
jgi:hypothetical protein